jgi:hypothetical protein
MVESMVEAQAALKAVPKVAAKRAAAYWAESMEVVTEEEARAVAMEEEAKVAGEAVGRVRGMWN